VIARGAPAVRPLFVQRLDGWARAAAPLALTLIAAIVNVIPLRLPSYSVIAPDLVLMAVFYWTVHRPDLMRPWTAFVVGLLDDVLIGTPLGVYALVLLFVHWAIIAQHRTLRALSFGLLWCGFALIAAGAKVVLVVLALAIGRGLIDPSVLFAQYSFTVVVYPLVALLMGRAQRAFLPAT
jgi:rod shape-determining protein MreD